MGLSVGIFRNFRDCLLTVRAEFRDCLRTVQVEISGLFSDNPNRIFGIVFKQSGTGLRFGFDLETDVFGFYGVFWYHSNSVTNCEGTKRCPVLCGSEIWSILRVIVVKY